MCASWINKSQLFMMHDRVINPFLEVINLSIAMSTLPTTVKFSWCWWNHFVTIAGQFYRCQLNVRYILPMVVDVTFIVLEPFFKFANAEIPRKICKSREVCGCVTLTIDHWSIFKNWRPQNSSDGISTLTTAHLKPFVFWLNGAHNFWCECRGFLCHFFASS